MVAPSLAWTILFAPLAACVAILLAGLHRPRLSSALAIASLVVGFFASATLLMQSIRSPLPVLAEQAIPWLTISGLRIEFGVLVDPLSILMLLVVTGVGGAIFIYSTGYMAQDPSRPRYFACLALFAFSMLGIVLANNLVTLFMCWELVGLSSYLLIGFWYEKPSAAEAGKKAFLVNRIADSGFILGILVLWAISGATGQERTFTFTELEHRIQDLAASGPAASWGLSLAGALIFCGVIGKSAQFPLHVWLPDAMEGPTPVSALIHAATMVAAGVYLLCRTFFLYAGLPQVLTLVAYIGSFTAIFAASLAIVQNDIKRILAYSTLSQLGYMVLGVGLGGTTAGMYHLTTHAFFKALLFLGAGCMIHALHTNDIWAMGGLLRSMPTTARTFLIGTLALCGIPPLSGFWSKDEILTLAYHQDPFLWVLGSITAAMTAFYMGRLCFVVLFRKVSGAILEKVPDTDLRGRHQAHHEAPAVMTWPLVFLAALSMIGGLLRIPAFLHRHPSTHPEFEWTVAFISTGCAVLGLAAAWRLYGAPSTLPMRLQLRWRAVYRFLTHKYYVDEFYGWLVRNVQERLATLCHLFERFIIIRLCVNGTAVTTRATGTLLRLAQTGKVQTYALSIFAGLLILVGLMIP